MVSNDVWNIALGLNEKFAWNSHNLLVRSTPCGWRQPSAILLMFIPMTAKSPLSSSQYPGSPGSQRFGLRWREDQGRCVS